MIEKQTSIDNITVIEDGTILVREVMRLVEDGNVLSKTYHRSSFTPGQDLSGQPANIVNIANVVWTPEVVQAYAQKTQAIGA